MVTTLHGARRTPAVAAGAAAVGFVLLESLRIWLPSVLFVFGDAGETSALVLAAFGLACLLVAPVLASLLGFLSPVLLWWLGSGTLVAGRAALIVVTDPDLRLVAASATVIGASTALAALAAGDGSGRGARIGAFAGIVAATCLHAGTRTLGLVWPGTTLSQVVATLVVVLVALVVIRTGRSLQAENSATAAGPPTGAIAAGSSAWPWWYLLPLLLLVTTLSGVPGRTALATGWSAPVVAVTLAVAHLAALALAVHVPQLGTATSGLLAAVAIPLGTVLALDAAGWAGVTGQVVLVLGLGALVGCDIEPRSRASARRRGVTAGLAVLLFGVSNAVYYSAYDLFLPFNNRVVLLVVAAFGAGLALTAARLSRGRPHHVRLDGGALMRWATAFAAVVAVVAVSAQPPGLRPAGEADPDRLRVAVYNVRFGFSLDGSFAAREQAELLRGFAPDVVVLNEVDRGWFSSGGHDALEVIGAELGLPHVLFAPAADEIWGNALLSRYPIEEGAVEALPRGADPMRRSQLAAVLALGDGRRVGVVGTHLTHVEDQGATRLPQARVVAATVALLRERQVPTVLVGDLNAVPGSPELATFATLLTDVLPQGTLTYPSDRPTQHIDHVLVSPELSPIDVHLPEVTLSDHRPIIVELSLAGT